MARKPAALRIEELEARKRSQMARLAAQEQRLDVRHKMLPGTWVISELRKAIANRTCRFCGISWGLSEMALRDDRKLLEELHNGERRMRLVERCQRQKERVKPGPVRSGPVWSGPVRS